MPTQAVELFVDHYAHSQLYHKALKKVWTEYEDDINGFQARLPNKRIPFLLMLKSTYDPLGDIFLNSEKGDSGQNIVKDWYTLWDKHSLGGTDDSHS
ncbi:MAG: hypothetical protein Q7R34_15915 [Dehalococcoidia bacterium]|nr:hypothetical protein [Dehalococcoidia bacterium]